MAKILIHYKLQPGVTQADFEDWLHTTDYPAMRGIGRVASYSNHRARGLLMGEGEPAMGMSRNFRHSDLDRFVAEDMPARSSGDHG